MKILFVNPWIYTSETRKIKRKKSIKDTMSFGLCSAFSEMGHDITLVEDINFKPTEEEEYNFHVLYLEPGLKGIFIPNKLPWYPQLKMHLKENHYDLLICSEAFFTSTFTCVRLYPQKTIVWQELALFQRAFFKIPAKLWYYIIVKYFYKSVRIVPRSNRAMHFIQAFSDNVSRTVIDHGVNIEEFYIADDTRKQFIIVSQLIPRKRIDKSIVAFERFVKEYDADFRLLIIGDGEQRSELERMAQNTSCPDHIEFKGFLPHNRLVEHLAQSYALLVSTEQDNNILTINEAIASGTPVVTNMTPYMSDYIAEKGLGIAKDDWDEHDLKSLVDYYEEYRKECIAIRNHLSYHDKVLLFEEEYRENIHGDL